MRTVARVCVGLAAPFALLLPVVALAQNSHDVRPDVDFAAIRTFGFKATPPMAPVAEKTTTYDSPLVRDRTNEAIAAQLESRGMKRDDQHPDVYVVSRRNYYVEYYGYGGYGPYGWGGMYSGVGYYPGYTGAGWGWGAGGWYEQLRGTLTVDLEDAATGALLWRGVETNNVHQTSKPYKRDKRVNKEVAEVFEHFPTVGAVAVATTGER